LGRGTRPRSHKEGVEVGVVLAASSPAPIGAATFADDRLSGKAGVAEDGAGHFPRERIRGEASAGRPAVPMAKARVLLTLRQARLCCPAVPDLSRRRRPPQFSTRRTTYRAGGFFPDVSRHRAAHSGLMSTSRGPRHISRRDVVAMVIGVIVALLGLLWFLQGAGIVHMRPVLCVSNCKPVTKSVAWLVIGALACVAGVALARRSARHVDRR
jgi:hypothetical protein